jgi:hypothetical protein
MHQISITSGAFGISTTITESFIDKATGSDRTWAKGSHRYRVGRAWFGVDDPSASDLNCSYDTIVSRIKNRGKHIMPSLCSATGHAIARAEMMRCRDLYAEWNGKLPEEYELISNYFQSELSRLDIHMAPDGDAAFDDRSTVLQLDHGDLVRIIAFRYGDPKRDAHNPVQDLQEVQLPAAQFYDCLQEWADKFTRITGVSVRIY